MRRRLTLAAFLALTQLAACGPALVGAGGVIIIDKVAEEKEGGDGLF
ncbi:hypothetical protein [Albidovulum sp.]